MKVLIEESQSFINSQKTKGVTMNTATLDAMVDEVKVTVKDSALSEQVTNTINDQKAKMSAAYNELVRRGMESKAGQFIKKCMDSLKDMLNKLVGHIKELWSKLLAMFNKAEVVASAPIAA